MSVLATLKNAAPLTFGALLVLAVAALFTWMWWPQPRKTA
jgi:hypothetical protein